MTDELRMALAERLRKAQSVAEVLSEQHRGEHSLSLPDEVKAGRPDNTRDQIGLSGRASSGA
ncbi:MAG: hypothetical protein QN147_09710 [Armatimonadota bacterium]|nr:hypothetical protein [Armatimonadota bacterium]MDR7423047.1 hypothetical protein [Armatimonadota bacterium]MDR7454339.1 hypothetical protein [Armatimonadota bacterium]MDR7512278.1 hypothetical protein [Armatimonadota bacterium]